MTLVQLKYLEAIFAHGFNISNAAKTLHTSQPGISRQIRLLEQELGINILVRHGGRIAGLTEQGARVMESAALILKEVANVKNIGDEVYRQEAGELRIAALHSVALSILPKAIAGVRSAYQAVTVEVQQASASHSFDLLQAGAVDFAVALEPPPAKFNLASFRICALPRLLLVRSDHPLLARSEVDLAAIAKYPLVFSNVLATEWDVARVFRMHGFEIRPMIRAMDASVIKSLVCQGAGIAILSGASYDEVRDVGVKSIDVSHLFEPCDMSLVLDPFRYIRGYGYLFIELMAKELTRTRVDRMIRAYVNKVRS